MIMMIIVMMTIVVLKCYRKIINDNCIQNTVHFYSISYDQHKAYPKYFTAFLFLILYFIIIITVHSSFTDPRSVLRLQNSDVRTQLQQSLMHFSFIHSFSPIWRYLNSSYFHYFLQNLFAKSWLCSNSNCICCCLNTHKWVNKNSVLSSKIRAI